MTVGTDAPDLAQLREQLDAVDETLLDLLRQRYALCREVAEYKRDRNLPMMAPERLDAVRRRASDFAVANGLEPEALAEIFELITAEACRLEDALIRGADPDRTGLGGRAVRIDHVAIAVRDLDAAIALFRDRYGFTELERRQVKGEISGMDSATMRAGGVTFVLCQGDSPASNVSRYIEHYGPGVQHVALAVRDQPEMLVDLRERGADLLTGVINAPGLDQSFTKRDANSGIQLEFASRTDNAGFNDANVRELFTAMEREDVY
jgi:chorismate mutase-like protein